MESALKRYRFAVKEHLPWANLLLNCYGVNVASFFKYRDQTSCCGWIVRRLWVLLILLSQVQFIHYTIVYGIAGSNALSRALGVSVATAVTVCLLWGLRFLGSSGWVLMSQLLSGCNGFLGKRRFADATAPSRKIFAALLLSRLVLQIFGALQRYEVNHAEDPSTSTFWFWLTLTLTVVFYEGPPVILTAIVFIGLTIPLAKVDQLLFLAESRAITLETAAAYFVSVRRNCTKVSSLLRWPIFVIVMNSAIWVRSPELVNVIFGIKYCKPKNAIVVIITCASLCSCGLNYH